MRESTTSKRGGKRRDKSPERLVKGAGGGFPRGRLIWARLFEAEAMEEGQDKSYSCAIRFDEDADLDAIRRGFKAACVDQFGSSKLPRKAHSCLIEGQDLEDLIEDDGAPEGTEPGMVILKLRRQEKFGPPQLWDQNVEPIESRSEMYSGCHVVADVEFFGWQRTTSSGVSCRLNGLQKVRDDDALGIGKNDTQDSFTKVSMKGGKNKRDRDEDDDRPARRGSRRARDENDEDDDGDDI